MNRRSDMAKAIAKRWLTRWLMPWLTDGKAIATSMANDGSRASARAFPSRPVPSRTPRSGYGDHKTNRSVPREPRLGLGR